MNSTLNNNTCSRGIVFVLSAPSGAGKTTVTMSLVERLSKEFALERVVTYTSRPARAQEVPGIDYYFITPEEFQEKIKQGFFIEWSTVYGAFYGSPCAVLEKLNRGISLIMVLDQQGAQALMERCRAVSIWLAPPTIKLLQDRLSSRATETEEQREFRLGLAKKELLNTSLLNRFSYTVTVGNFNETVARLEAVIRCELTKSKGEQKAL